MILCDYIIGCACGETDIVEHKLELGERPPAVQLPQSWVENNGVIMCPTCLAKYEAVAG